METPKPPIDWAKVLNIIIRILTIGLYHVEKRKKSN